MPNDFKDMSEEEELAYGKGFVNALEAFAWWKDGEQYVGTTGTLLKDAITGIYKNSYFNPMWTRKELDNRA